MKKRSILCGIIIMLLLAFMPVSAQAAWKTTKKGTIYAIKKSPGYKRGWHTIKGSTYYFNPSNGIMYTGWQNITTNNKAYTYYFGDDGKMRTGFITVDSVRYYLNANGILQRGFIRLGGKVYYAETATGALLKNTWVDGLYYFQNDYTMAVGKYVNGIWVDANGKRKSGKNVGFVYTGGATYYYDKNGNRVSGWVTVGNNSYYFAPKMATGWFKVGSYTYYARSNGAVMKNGWQGKSYLTSSGAKAFGWATIGGNRYYFDSNGNYVKGVKTINGKRYRFKDTGVLNVNYWYTSKKGGKYYYGGDGARVYGLQKIGGLYYYFNSKSGKMQKKFIQAPNGKRYYAHKSKGHLFTSKWFKKSGYKYYAFADAHLATGVQKISGKLYGFSATGRLYTKKKRTIDGKTYYFNKNGMAITNKWKKIGGKYYFFNSNGVMMKDTIVDGYVVSATGVRGAKAAGGWTTVNGAKKYVVGGKAVTGFQTISGSTYYFKSDGTMVTGITTISSRKYYFYPDGKLAKSITIAVSNKEYTINSKGVITKEKTIVIDGNTLGSQIAKYAIKYVGNKYVYGGTSLTGGADCSGFVYTVFGNHGIKLLRVADDQMKGPGSAYISQGYKKAVEVSKGYMLPGDLVFYGSGNYASHVAIYIGNGNIVHASNSQPYPAGGIKISPYDYQTPIRIMRYWS